jgi:hypothetical protein
MAAFEEPQTLVKRVKEIVKTLGTFSK